MSKVHVPNKATEPRERYFWVEVLGGPVIVAMVGTALLSIILAVTGIARDHADLAWGVAGLLLTAAVVSVVMAHTLDRHKLEEDVSRKAMLDAVMVELHEILTAVRAETSLLRQQLDAAWAAAEMYRVRADETAEEVAQRGPRIAKLEHDSAALRADVDDLIVWRNRVSGRITVK
jgi:hypothetical protein